MLPRFSNLVGAFALSLLGAVTSAACTIFVLTSETGTLFCNNEDSANPNTRVWFMPGSEGSHGCAFVGYDDGLPQGGVNDAGLALDWVAGGFTKWIPDAAVPDASGFSAVRILRTCSTVEAAVAYLQTQRDDPAFAYAHLLVADRAGSSAIVDVRKGAIVVERSMTCRGFGYGARTLDKRLATKPAPTLSTATEILAACRQRGRYATKYSNVYNLRTGEIVIVPGDGPDGSVSLNLADELRRGAHCYDMAQLRAQLAQGGKPLPALFARPLVGELLAVPDPQPQRTAQFQQCVDDFARGVLPSTALAPEFAKTAKHDLAKIHTILDSWGVRQSASFLGEGADGLHQVSRYEFKCARATVLLRFTADANGRVAGITLEDLTRPTAPSP